MAYRITQSTRALRALTTVHLPPSSLRTITTPTTTTTRPTLHVDPKDPHSQRTQQPLLETLEYIDLAHDRTILCPERAETSYSGTDNAVGDDSFAYDPSITNPEGEFQCFEDEVRVTGEVDPLFISPANREFSRLLDRELDGRAVRRDRGDRLGRGGSVRGWVKKGREVKIRSGGKGKGVDEFERLLRGLRRVQMRDNTKEAEVAQGQKGN
ncbi:hypothetical protein BDW62DRAFT_205959 [Aspergillus aurantiobrunneus]